ncbi:MAG TPA: glycosyltransferase [Thermoanaerobaculia bacterium]|nr:glycosyltransferase [Thermoanaerobaculia bacterium]
MRIAAVIPTRNRASLAAAAARSLLDQDCPIEIFLSDNSSSPDELRAFSRDEPRVHYLRPERELPMAAHWDWALRQAMERSDATHFTLHYDRKYSKPGTWGAMAAVAAQWPDMLVTYSSDYISALSPPLRVWQIRWTGRVFRVRTSRITELIATGRVPDMAHVIPILSNCVVPRAVLQSITSHFGDICNSTAADACFASRFIALHDHYLHLDRALAILYAFGRSAGVGYVRGGGGDLADFQKTWGERPWLDAAPIPGLDLGQNMLYHEYELARRETGDRLPPVDRAAYLNHLGESLRWVEAPELRAELRHVLEAHGWKGSEAPPVFAPFGLRDKVRQALRTFLADRFGIRPRSVSGFTFEDEPQALQFALKYPHAAQDDDNADLDVLEPEEMKGP